MVPITKIGGRKVAVQFYGEVFVPLFYIDIDSLN